jgi:hypothetical protein
MADWSQLPTELLQQISQKLNNSQLYLLRFHSVCSSWRRSSIPNCHHNHLPSKLPHFPADEISYIRHLYKQNVFLIKPPPTNQTPLHPWLIRIGSDLNAKTYLYHPLHPHHKYDYLDLDHHLIDFNQLSVLHLRDLFYIHRTKLHINRRSTAHRDYEKAVVASACEVGQPLALLTFDNNSELPMIVRCEDDSGTNILTMPGSLWGDICIFKGRSCVTDINGRTIMIEPEDSTVQLLANPVFGGNVKFLVETECKTSLLLVDCHGIDIRAGDKDVRFDVFKLDEKEKMWIKLTTLGDMVLILGEDGAFSASALDLRVSKGNCVIFSRNSNIIYPDAIQYGLRIFHLDQDWVSHLSDYPDYMRLFWPPPTWIPKQYNYSKSMFSCIERFLI